MAYKQQKNQVYNTIYDEEIQEYPEITSRLLKLLNNDYDFKKESNAYRDKKYGNADSE